MDQTPNALRLHDARPRRFNVDEYHRMAEAGVIGPEERVELIEGEIIQMAAMGGPHIRALMRLNRLLTPMVAGRAEVSVQCPIQLDDESEPEPDLALLVPPKDEFDERTPQADEVLLLIEVAHTSLEHDRRRKRPLYARSSIRELWIVDLDERVVEVCRRPGPDGYASIETARPGQVLGVEALPGVEVPVTTAVGRRPA